MTPSLLQGSIVAIGVFKADSPLVTVLGKMFLRSACIFSKAPRLSHLRELFFKVLLIGYHFLIFLLETPMTFDTKFID